MSRSLTFRAAIAAAATAALVAGAVAAPASAAPPVDPPYPATFEKVLVDPSYQGAAFTVVADIYNTGKKDIITSSFGAGFPTDGSLQIYRQGETVEDWTETQVFNESAEIIVPNEPKIVDVSGDGMLDIIVPGGFFFDTVPWNPQNRGSITWWENNGPDDPWTRHDVIVDDPWAYHGVQYADIDGDGIKDIVTSGEQAKDPSIYTDDLVETRYFKGAIDDITDERTFGPPIKLSDNGGSIPVVEDVDGDGQLDILTAQYFGVDEPSYLWLERVGATVDDEVSESNFVMHEIADDLGRGFQIKRVPDFRGDGVDRWIATNHDTFGTPGPDGGVFELTPGDDITEPWTSVTLNDFPIKPRASAGQGAPGGVNAGDVDGDGDLDLVVSGDGDPRLFWIEQKEGGSFETHILVDWDPVAGQLVTGFGQAGGAIAEDLDGDGRNELVFSSWDRKQVAIWVREIPPPSAGITAVTSGGDAVPASTPQAVRAGDEISFSSGANDQWTPDTAVKATICTGLDGAGCPPTFVEGILWAGSDPAYSPTNPVADAGGVIDETTLLLASTGGNVGAAYLVLYQGVEPAAATNMVEIPVTLLGARTLSAPADVAVGTTAAVTGTNWYPGETVTLKAGTSAAVTTVANASGAISANVPVTDASATTITADGAGTTDASAPIEVKNLAGTFTRSPASVFATQAVKLTPSNVNPDVSTVSINWGDGKVTNNASKTAPTNHVYTKAGTSTIKVTLRNAATGLSVVKTVGTVQVKVDKAAPVVTIKALKAKATKVKKVNGTITDAGLGSKSVTVSLIQKRSNGWYAYNGKKWVKAKNKKQAIKKSKKITVSATSGPATSTTWSATVKKVKKGKITVTYFGTDVAGNKSKAKNYSKKLK